MPRAGGDERSHALILDCAAVVGVDSTAAVLLEEGVKATSAAGTPLLLAGTGPDAMQVLERFGLVAAIGGLRCCFSTVHDAVRAVAAREVMPPQAGESEGGPPPVSPKRGGGWGGRRGEGERQSLLRGGEV